MTTKTDSLREWAGEIYLAARSDLNPPTDHPEGVDVIIPALTKCIQDEREAAVKEVLNKHQHNWLIKEEHSGWMSRTGRRELKTVYCSVCLAEREI